MENASKALIIAGEVLIGVLLLTLMVVVFHAMGIFSQTVNDNIAEKNIAQFNAQFLGFEGRKNLTAQDVVTMGNLARDYNKTEEGQNANRQIKVQVMGVDSKYANIHQLTDEQTYQFMQEYGINKKASFTCIQMTYQEATGQIYRIGIKLNT